MIEVRLVGEPAEILAWNAHLLCSSRWPCWWWLSVEHLAYFFFLPWIGNVYESSGAVEDRIVQDHNKVVNVQAHEWLGIAISRLPDNQFIARVLDVRVVQMWSEEIRVHTV